jgi:hypothetical protein
VPVSTAAIFELGGGMQLEDRDEIGRLPQVVTPLKLRTLPSAFTLVNGDTRVF